VAAFVSDQAEGLRRLLSPGFVRILTLASPRPRLGKSTVVLNLAAAMARRGRRVLVLDEHAPSAQLQGTLRSSPQHDLLAAVQGKAPLEACVGSGPAGVQFVCAHDAIRRLPSLHSEEQSALADAMRQLAHSADVLLVDPAPGTSDSSISLSLAAQELLLLTTQDTQSITDTYALIKRLAQNFAHRRFHVLVNKAKASAQAEGIYNNMAQAAARYLGVQLAYLGHLPAEEQMRRATRLEQAVVDAYPDSASAQAFRTLAERIDLWPYPADDTGRVDNFLHKLLITSRLTAENAHF
jgi:flagellar biosynthesis protein FlhG